MEEFLNGASYEQPDDRPVGRCLSSFWFAGANLGNTLTETVHMIFNGYKANNYTKLTASDCFNDYYGYPTNVLNSRRNLILIVQQPVAPMNMTDCGYDGRPWNGSSVLGIDYNNMPTYGSDGTKRMKPLLQNETWNIREYGIYNLDLNVQACWSETTKVQPCQLQFMSYNLVTVVVCNLIKFICMCTTVYHLWNLDQPILATVGDAVQCFLEHSDDKTKGYCLIGLEDIRQHKWGGKFSTDIYLECYNRESKSRLYSATAHWRWWSTMMLCTTYIVVGFVLWKLSVDISSYDLGYEMTMPFGFADSHMVLGLDGKSGFKLIIDIIVANSVQLALSATYFLYNSLYTAQCAALEWTSYIKGRPKSLRVTWPRGQQRSTYYLQLPYRYGITLIILQALMHFLLSQSIFLARLQYYDSFGAPLDIDQSFTDVGVSPRAALTTCLVGLVLVLAQILHAYRPLDNRIPIHGNQSAVISAMCHPDTDPGPDDLNSDSDLSPSASEVSSIALKPLMWGVTRQPVEETGSGLERVQSLWEGAGHCSFTTKTVELPQVGKYYR